jgi:hypothetical protein
MNLNDVQIGKEYIDKRFDRRVRVIAVHCDDGATLIAEFTDNLDVLLDLLSTEACYLTPVDSAAS